MTRTEEIFSIAFRFDSAGDAGKAYEATRDLVFGDDLEASVYRVCLNGIWHMVVVGEAVPLPRLQTTLPSICERGESTTLPDEVVLTLALRRAQFDGPDVKFERRSVSPS